jgi:uncharacterized membrane protein
MKRGKTHINDSVSSVPEKLTILFLVSFVVALFIKVMFY